MPQRHDMELLLFQRGLYYSRVWFLFSPEQPRDVLAVLRRELPDGLWRLEYRFRYYNDDKAFDSTDRKNFYSGTYPEHVPEGEIVDKTSEAIGIIASMQGMTVETIVIESDDPTVIHEKLAESPHFKMRMDDSGAVQ